MAKASGRTVQTPRAAEARSAIECRVDRTVALSPKALPVTGATTHYFVGGEVWRDGRFDLVLFTPLTCLGGRYAALDTPFKMNRSSCEDVESHGPTEALSLVRRSDGR